MATEHKVAVITGTSQGIGAALVRAYRNSNYRVVVTARSMKSLSDADVLVISGDIADRKTAERAISEGMAQFGRIDTLRRIPSGRMRNLPPCTRSAVWVRSPTSSTRSCVSRRPAS